MVDQHYHSQLSQETIRYFPAASSGDLVLTKGLGFSTGPQGLILVPDTGISGDSWNGLSFLPKTQEYGLPTVDCVNTVLNLYSPIPARSPNHHLTLPSNETSLADVHQRPFMDQCSLSDAFSGPYARDKVPDVFAVEASSILVDEWALGIAYPSFDTGTPQSHEQMTNESRATTDAVSKPSEHQHSIPDTRFPVRPFCAKPFPDDCSCSPLSFKCSISEATRDPSVLQEENQAQQIHDEGEHLVTFVPEPPSQRCTPPDRGTSIEKMAKEMHQCGSCCVSFSQSQGLKRHNKDKHEPKKPCDFCEVFTWPRGRRYVYRRHLQKVHPDTVSPSMCATPVARKRGVKFKGRHFRQSSIARRTS